MVHQYRFLTSVCFLKVLLDHCLPSCPAGIIEGANDGRGRGKQGVYILNLALITRNTSCFQSLPVRTSS
jgi:hypothetical protein